MAKKIKIKKILIVILLMLTTILPAQSQTHITDSELDSLCTILDTCENPQIRIDVYYKIATQHANIDTIEKYSKFGVNEAKANHDVVHCGYFNKILGWLKYQNHRYFESHFYYREAIKNFEEEGYISERADVLSSLGNVMFETGDFLKGINYKFKALKIFNETNDTVNISAVYRNVGRYSAEYQLYTDAELYLNQALVLDKQSSNNKNFGRDLFWLGMVKSQSCKKRNVEDIKESNMYLLESFKKTSETNDNIYVIYSSFALSLQFAELCAITSNWCYADSCYHYYNIAKKVTEEIGYDEFAGNLILCKAETMILAGNSNDAIKLITKYEENHKNTRQQRYMLFRAYELYYMFNKDYKGMLKFLEKKNYFDHKMYVSEFAVKLLRISSEADYEIKMTNFDKSTKKREIQKAEEKKHNSLMIKIVSILGTLVGSIILVLVIMFLKNKKLNEELVNQKEEILNYNEELATINNEISEQSQKIENQIIEIKHQRNKLASYNLKIVMMMDRASRKQIQAMPSIETMKKIFKGIFILWQPLEIVSGDFYWGTEINNLKFIAVADCTGHGIPGACLSMLGIAMLNSIVAKIDTQTVNAAEILDILRDRISNSLTRGVTDGDVHDGMDMALCIIDKDKQRLSYSGAYRPLWIIKEGVLTEYKADRMPIAHDEDHENKFTNCEIKLEGNEKIYIFSDGITDQFGLNGQKIQKLKPKRLRTILENNYNLPDEKQKEVINDEIKAWAGNEEQTDDRLIIGITDI